MGSADDREASWPPQRVWAAAVAVWICAAAAGQWLGRTAGSTRAERRQVLPGDELELALGATQPAAIRNSDRQRVACGPPIRVPVKSHFVV